MALKRQINDGSASEPNHAEPKAAPHFEEVQPSEVMASLRAHQALGLHVSDRVIAEVQKPGRMNKVVLGRADFFKLVWQSSDETRPLAPLRHPRTLGDCALRLSHFSWSFDRLVELGWPWFAACAEIDKAFDLSKFGLIFLNPLNEVERGEAPQGSYYIYDGVHRSIVLAKRLTAPSAAEYRPIQAILFERRR